MAAGGGGGWGRQGRSEHFSGTNKHAERQRRHKWSRGEEAAPKRGSNRGSTEEGRQKEILTKPRYTHKSPDTTRLLPVFYRAAPRRRNSMTGQFLQWKYGPPLPSCLSLRYHSCFLSIPPDIILSPLRRPLFSIIFFPPSALLLLALYIPAVMFPPRVSIHLCVALLIPSHLLSSALIPPVSLPALPEPFRRAVPFPPTPLRFPYSS